MFWQYFEAIAKKQWAGPAPQLPKTITPIEGLSQRAALEINSVPIILASGAGSLIKNFPGHHSVVAVGKMAHTGMDFYHVYLSNDPGTYIRLVVAQTDPKTILESRIYQRYDEKVIPYQTVAEATQAGDEEPKSAEFWLLDNPDPNIGGLIGCPIMPGKFDDGNIQYQRTWASENRLRIQPFIMTEYILGMDGSTSVVSHQTMHYGRGLTDSQSEYLLVSMVGQDGGARNSLNSWLGMDIEVSDTTGRPDLTVYPSTE